MAAMGRRDIARKSTQTTPELGIAIPAVNLGVVPTLVSPVTTLGALPSVVGGPIMREDFITTTGVMPHGIVGTAIETGMNLSLSLRPNN